MTQIPSSIKDNHNRGSVGSFLKQEIDEGSRLSVVSAYFTIYAYHHLKDKLDTVESLDFLFGEPAFINTLDPSKTDKKEFEIQDDQLVIPLHNRLGQKSVAKECSDWIEARVNIRSVVKSNFLHGKMYHIRNNGVQKAILGSSNFTVRGLGLGGNSNIELNMEATDDRDRADLLKWFREIWEDTSLVEDVKEDVLRYLEQLYAENDPEFIYFKTLYHLFEKFLSEQAGQGLLDETIGFFDTNIWNMLYAFQKDAVKGAVNKMLRHGGCVLADSVGLGKTFEALAVIKYFELLNNKVLVLCPKKLSDNWTMYQAQNNSLLNPLVDDRLGYTVLCHTDLSRESGRSVSSIELSLINWGNYDLVVIDESHNFRNNAKGQRDEEGNIIRKSRYEKLMSDIINSGVRTKVLLLSATPVNNDLKDLRNQLYFISGGKDDSFYEKTGVKHLAHTMKEAQKVFTRWADPGKHQVRDVKTLLDKLDSSFFKLLDELTIARSRKHIQTYYKDEVKRIGAFPIRLPVISKAPDIDTKDEFPAYDRINTEIMTYKLSLFNPWAYVRDEWKGVYEKKAGRAITAFSQERREHYLIGMMKVNFLKRLESSIASFEISMERTIEKITGLEERIRAYKDAGSDSPEIESPEMYDADDAELNDANSIGKKLRYHLEHLDLDLWLKDLKSDKDALVLLKHTAKAVTPDRDKKLAVLKSLIREKIKHPINDENKKIIIFTAFTDTAKYLHENLFQFVRDELNLHIALVSGSGTNKTSLGKSRFEHILTNFSPISKNRDKIRDMPQDEEISVLIATDCISEGQNLQDCDYLINYDIHWNPVRIIQRFGRIDRLGSKNEKIQLVNFWPTDDLNNYINLKDRVEARMALVDITATGEDNLLDAEQIKDLIEDDLSFRSRQLKRLKKEVLDLEELDENVSLSEFTLDDFRVELANYIEKNREKLQKAPLGLYAVVPSPESEHFKPSRVGKISESAREIIRPGVIFCLRQKGDTQGNESVNPLSPYFLVYVRRDGTVRFNYTHAKQILEIFRLLGNGVEKPYDILCDLFNKETKNGSEMRNYNMLLSRAISEIRSVFKKKANIRLTRSRGAPLIPKKKQAEESGQFELISWLVIK
ncbi:helicase-related protein [Desulfonema magnum]|uniref:ATP-dependent RNA helicase n=1 Tax=Desulfonema magnum TaxID=45655 RepID=A0A975BL65_9BACT|nr:helicase-related protein [Desulfonema magnum]QTA87470.1 ATP-dependent RNA helicase [Desulfonema magnum]